MTIDEFKNKNQPKCRSKLIKFQTEILELRKANYSLQGICDFLKQNGIDTTLQNLSNFLKRVSIETPAVIQQTQKSTTNNTSKVPEKVMDTSSSFPKFERKGKDLDIQSAPDWATD